MKQLLISFLVVSSLVVAQTPGRSLHDLARPAAGWDSLKSQIAYPEIARRAGVQGYSNVSVEIDENGKVLTVSVSGQGIFRSNIEEVVKASRWLPEINNGKAVKSTVVFELQFQLKNIQDMPKKRVLIIESEIPNYNSNK